MTSRIVFTVATGAARYAEMALGLARSLALVGDDTRRIVMSDVKNPALEKWFDQVVAPTSGPPYLRKLAALEATDADAVLFIDSDSLVFRRLDPILEFCAGKPIAVQGEATSEGHWYGWLRETLPRIGLDKIMRFNGGMIYYERGPETERLFSEVKEVVANYGATGLDMFRGEVPDEPCIAIAMGRTGIGELIPNEMDFMNTPVGLVGRLRMDVMKGECKFLKRADRMRFIKPFILHAGKYVNSTIYWNQLARLEWLDRYERTHGYGYMGFWHKLRRSVQRRLLRISGKL